MRISAAYITVILIWATTPLTVKWGGEGSGFLVAIISRMAIGLVCILALMSLFGVRWAWHRKALLTYLCGVIGVFGAMMCVYWSAQFIPSGWISVVFGLSPIVTALLAACLLNEERLSAVRYFALLVGVSGLGVMYDVAAEFGGKALLGITGIFLSTWLHGFSAVLIKRVNANISGMTATAGSLLFSLPLFGLAWWFSDQSWPTHVSDRSLAAIVYTGVIATAIGFSLYYFVLNNLSAIRVSLITLFSPVLALWLGNVLNEEPITTSILFGTGLILAALMLFETCGVRAKKSRSGARSNG